MISWMKNYLPWIGLLVFFMFAMHKVGEAQEPYKGMRISWKLNPESENVGWYIIKWDRGESDWQTMATVAETDQGRVDISLTKFPPLTLGEQVCLRVIAAKGVERSPPSKAGCIIYKLPGPPPAQPSSLSQPAQPALTLTR